MSAQSDHTSIAWPEWMIRYVASGSRQAFEDLMWSVGGSPPWGGVRWGEAEAVYALLEAYRGPGEAPESAYDAVLAHAHDDRRGLAVEAFRLHDTIASDPEHFTEEDVLRGLQIAEQIGHEPLSGYFQLLLAQALHRSGNLPDALSLTRNALITFTNAGVEDAVYVENALKAGQNCISFAAADGEFYLARAVIGQMRAYGLPEGLEQLDELLGDAPEFPPDTSELEERAAQLLEEGDSLRALEWYAEVERRARERQDEASLGGALGDKAVAFRRVGNTRRALETYGEAIELCRLHEQHGLLSAWTGNAGQLLMEADRLDEAEIYFSESLEAATRSRDPAKIAIAARNLGALLSQRGRFADAMQHLERAAAAAGGSADIKAILRETRAVVLLQWGAQLFAAARYTDALTRYQQAVQLLELKTASNVGAALQAWVTMTAIHEQLNDLRSAIESVSQAINCARALRDADMLRELEQLKGKLTRKSLLV